ncbi:MAG TPA: SGNH/GDSL hydrolase family protein [Actinomycetota bacterium]|nr:SGNH/GDSL hydrolase family protein [Actinomycetota bacterium]
MSSRPKTQKKRWPRRVLVTLAIVVGVPALVLGVEIWLALRREYLPTDEPLELDAAFGPEGAPPLELVVLGDSTAAGIGVDDPADAYPTLLARRLAAATRRRVELTAVGIAGARVGDVADEQAPRAVALDPDLVFVGIGANDVTHLTSLGDVRTDVTRALRTLQSGGAAVVVAGPPDMRVPVWHQPLRQLSYLRGKQVEGVVEDVARAEGAGFVELADETGPFFEEDPEAHFSDDGFHPGPLGYRRWADAIFPVLLEAARSSD